MKIAFDKNACWKWLFFGLIIGYCGYYGPFGVNETDGGFLTGLAWQVLQGKVLYQDILYVRPPLPVWLRAVELYWLPEQWGVLGERWIFYGKVGLYSWLAAALLYTDHRRWILAVFGFVVSAHCYPAMAWHTVDGILFSVLATYWLLIPSRSYWGTVLPVLSGISLFAALLCKQSFYPLGVLFGVVIWVLPWRKTLAFLGGFMWAIALFFNYLWHQNCLDGFLRMTSGATSSAQAIQHGLLDYAMITPELALPSLVILGLVYWCWRRPAYGQWAIVLWAGWLLALVGSYALVTWFRQEHTAPFAQSRALFLIAVGWIAAGAWKTKNLQALRQNPAVLNSAILLAITWCATISWGYGLPMLFSTPWIWAALEVSDRLWEKSSLPKAPFRLALLLALLLTFRLGYEFVYRDGRRSDMQAHLGDIFPALNGIYSNAETAAQYRDLKRLAAQYGPRFAVLPAFPQANYLTQTPSLLPLDWVVNRETNGDNTLVYRALAKQRPVLFFEKNYQSKWGADSELSVTRDLFEQTKTVEETPFFIVKQWPQ